jgi:hypothetical protein
MCFTFTGPLGLWITTAVLYVMVIGSISFKAALSVEFIRTISTLGMTITELIFHDALTIITGDFGLRVAATDFGVVE